MSTRQLQLTPAATSGYRFPPGMPQDLAWQALRRRGLPNAIRHFQNLVNRYGDIAHYRVRGKHIIFLNDPEYIREILIVQSANFVKERTQRRSKLLLGEGMITADGAAHRRQRQVAQPAFHRQQVPAYAETIVRCAARLRDRWQTSEERDIYQDMMKLTLGIVGETLFRTELGEEIGPLNAGVADIMNVYHAMVLLPGVKYLIHLPFTPLNKFLKARKRLHATVGRMIAEHRAVSGHGFSRADDAASQSEASVSGPAFRRAVETGSQPEAPVSGHAFRRTAEAGPELEVSVSGHAFRRAAETAPERGALAPDLLDLMLASQDQMNWTDADLRDQVVTVFLAGYETMAIALTWTWYLLSQNPDAREKMYAEIDAVLDGRLPTYDDLPKLHYTEMVLAESMRLYPPAWAMGREAIADFELGPYRLPKGTTVLMSQFVLQRDPRFFPDPLRFDPLRHTPEAKAARPRFTYFPFGMGPRQCIGEAFAWMEGVLVLATFAQRWKMNLVPDHPVEPEPLFTLRPKYGMRMRVEAR